MKIVLSLIALSALAIVVSACRPPIADDVDELEVDVALLTEDAQRAQVLAALEPLDPLRYHHLDQIVRDQGRIPADAVIWARRARETLGWVSWPLELQDHVAQYVEWLDSLLAAFRNDDAQAAAEPSRIVHALAHTFEATLEAWLSNESLPAVPELAGLEPPAHHGDDHDGMSMGDDQSMSEHQQHEMSNDHNQ